MSCSSWLNWPSGREHRPEDRRHDRRGEHDGDENDHFVDDGQPDPGVQEHGEGEAEEQSGP